MTCPVHVKNILRLENMSQAEHMEFIHNFHLPPFKHNI